MVILIYSFFSTSEKLYRAYVSRNVMLTVIATVEFAWYVAYCLPLLSKSVYFKCQVGPLSYDCTGHPGTFYVYLGNYIIIRRKIAQDYCVSIFQNMLKYNASHMLYSSILFCLNNGCIFGMLRTKSLLDCCFNQILRNASNNE